MALHLVAEDLPAPQTTVCPRTPLFVARGKAIVVRRLASYCVFPPRANVNAFSNSTFAWGGGHFPLVGGAATVRNGHVFPCHRRTVPRPWNGPWGAKEVVAVWASASPNSARHPRVGQQFSLQDRFRRGTVPARAGDANCVFVSRPVKLSLGDQGAPAISLPGDGVQRPDALVCVFYQGRVQLPGGELRATSAVRHLRRPFIQRYRTITACFVGSVRYLFRLV